MPITLREVLALDVVRRGAPAVVAGHGRLDAPIRWVHAAELADVGRLLRGGELLLSTGIALPSSPPELAGYIDSLADAGVAGLVIELGRRFFDALPRVLVDAAAARELPLVELHREVRFVEITETVHARLVDELLIERAAAALAIGRLLTRQPESLERQAHRTLISAIIDLPEVAPAEAAAAEARARAMGVPVAGRQLVATVLRLPDPGAGGPFPAADSGPAAVLRVAEAAASACRGADVPALVGALDDVRVAVLLSLPPGSDADAALGGLATRLRRHLGPPPAPPTGAPDGGRAAAGLVIGTGRPAGALREVRESFLEAREVSDIAVRHADGRPFYRLPDLRLRGLLHLLREDSRLRAFAERELGPLLAHDAGHGTSLLADLTAFLQAGGNKALAASRAHLARPTFYQRLRLIEHVLGVSLDDPESRTSLHVALLALHPGSGPPPAAPDPPPARP